MSGCYPQGDFAQSIESAQFYVQRRLTPQSDFRERARTDPALTLRLGGAALQQRAETYDRRSQLGAFLAILAWR